MNPPKVLKLRVQVDVAHSTLRTVSMLVTCLPQDASPEKQMFPSSSVIHKASQTAVYDETTKDSYTDSRNVAANLQMRVAHDEREDLQKRIS